MSSDFRGRDFRHADMRFADLRDTDLRGADLRHADFRGADLTGADLWGADLRDINLTGAHLDRNNIQAIIASFCAGRACSGVLRDATIHVNLFELLTDLKSCVEDCLSVL